MKKIVIFLVSIGVIVVAIAVYMSDRKPIRQPVIDSVAETRVDVCDKPYTWDFMARSCVHTGEFTDDEKRAINTARDYLGGQLKTVVAQSVETLRCEGCFNVVLLADGIVGRVELENWTMRRYTYGDIQYEKPSTTPR
jgi:hypothetical protein